MKLKIFSISVGITMFIASCKKGPDVNVMSTGNFNADTSVPLKDAANFPIGAAINLNLYNTNATYRAIANRDYNSFTFENEMKHSSIVQDNGTFNYANADALINATGNTTIYGHVLAWHSQQRGSYLRSYAGITVPAAAELLSNPGFESGLSGWSVFNSGNPAGTATITATNVAGEVRTGSGAMKVVNPTAYPGSQWRVQVSSAAFATVPGRNYTISYWVRATSPGGSIRLSTGPSSPQYQGDQTIGTAWQQVSWTITASLTSTTFLFDMGQAANTYLIDDASVKEVVVAPSGAQVALKVDTALQTYITNMVNRYKTRVRAWDVVNEMFTENGEIRNNTNTPQQMVNGSPDNGWFVWSHYLGRDFGLKAFNYARAADPTADLYINDFNLETNPRKLDSLISYVAEIRNRGAKVDGIGTQMHINWNTNYATIESMFRKLAATGLKIRITELDIATMLNSPAPSLTPQLMAYQANMAKFVVDSYMKLIPAPQRAGITIWGIHDNSSWRFRNGTEFPLFYDSAFRRKPAYAAFLQGLQGK